MVEARKNYVRVSGLNGLRGWKVEHRVVLGATFTPVLLQITPLPGTITCLPHCTLCACVLARKTNERVAMRMKIAGPMRLV